ncbi:MAG TPA: hypothetical protein DCZ72_05405 [Armatimonadetes bacterium]|nr:hypothetical protein [Armatimonadota bacterium]
MISDRTRLGRPAGSVRLALLLLVGLFLAPALSAAPSWQTFLYGGNSYAAASDGTEAWIGTGAGLRIYTPQPAAARVRQMTSDDDLPGPAITALAFVPGGLWAGATGGAVGRYDFETKTWAHYGSAARFPSFTPTRLVWDGQDIWAATAGGGVARFSPLRAEWEVWDRADGLPSDQVLSLASDGDAIWAGTDRGLAQYQPRTHTWAPLSAAADQIDVLGDAILDLALTTNYLWLATYTFGLARIDRTTGELVSYDTLARDYAAGRIFRLLAAPNGDLWIATNSGLIRAAAEGTGAWTAHPRGPWEVTGLTATDSAIWVATGTEGVYEYRPATDTWQTYRGQEALPSGALSALAAGPDAGYLGFHGAGVAQFPLATGRWNAVTPPFGAPLRVIDLAVQDRWVYVAGADGLGLYDTREDTWQILRAIDYPELKGDDWTSVVANETGVWFAGPGRLAHLGPDFAPRWVIDLGGETSLDPRAWPRLRLDRHTGDVWIIMATGAVRWERATNQLQTLGGDWLQPTEAGLAEREGRLIRDLQPDADGVWVVGLDSVAQFSKVDGGLTLWTADAVPALAEPRLVSSAAGSVWVAAAAGLCRFDRRLGGWEVAPWPAEIAGQVVGALAADAFETRLVWVATARHVARLELAADGPEWRVYPRRTGLVPAVSQIIPTRSVVWFGGLGGVSLYRRDLGALGVP